MHVIVKMINDSYDEEYKKIINQVFKRKLDGFPPPSVRIVSAACKSRSLSINLLPNSNEMIKDTITARDARKEMYWKTPAPGSL